MKRVSLLIMSSILWVNIYADDVSSFLSNHESRAVTQSPPLRHNGISQYELNAQENAWRQRSNDEINQINQEHRLNQMENQINNLKRSQNRATRTSPYDMAYPPLRDGINNRPSYYTPPPSRSIQACCSR